MAHAYVLVLVSCWILQKGCIALTTTTATSSSTTTTTTNETTSTINETATTANETTAVSSEVTTTNIPVYDKCGGTITGLSGIITWSESDNIGLADVSVKCIWLIRAAKNKLIKLTFEYLLLVDYAQPCNFEYLLIKDGNKEKGLFCDNTIPREFISTSRIVTFRLRTDELRNVSQVGLTAKFIQVDDPVCGYQVGFRAGKFGTNDVLTDAGTYGNDVCVWIVGTFRSRVELYFTKMNIQPGDDCSVRYLEIYINDGNELLGRFCGTSKPPLLSFDSFSLHVHLKTNGSSEHAQFVAWYLIPGTKCGGLITDPTGVLRSPSNSDGQYPTYIDCVWMLLAFYYQIVSFEFSYIDIEDGGSNCRYDRLEFYDGSFDPDAKLVTFCGSYVPPSVQSSTEALFIKFMTDGSTSGVGFRGKYTHIDVVDPTTTARTTKELPTTSTAEAAHDTSAAVGMTSTPTDRYHTNTTEIQDRGNTNATNEMPSTPSSKPVTYPGSSSPSVTSSETGSTERSDSQVTRSSLVLFGQSIMFCAILVT